MEERIVRIMQANERDQDAAAQILEDERIRAHFEQKIANANVRHYRRTGYCPTCGAESDDQL